MVVHQKVWVDSMRVSRLTKTLWSNFLKGPANVTTDDPGTAEEKTRAFHTIDLVATEHHFPIEVSKVTVRI
jgi:hypothetical protein